MKWIAREHSVIFGRVTSDKLMQCFSKTTNEKFVAAPTGYVHEKNKMFIN